MQYDENFWTDERKARFLHGIAQGRSPAYMAFIYQLTPGQRVESLVRQFQAEGIEPHQVRYHLDLEDARDE